VAKAACCAHACGRAALLSLLAAAACAHLACAALWRILHPRACAAPRRARLIRNAPRCGEEGCAHFRTHVAARHVSERCAA